LRGLSEKNGGIIINVVVGTGDNMGGTYTGGALDLI